MNTYCDDCKRCTGGCMKRSEVPGEGEDHNRCHECEAKIQGRIEALEWLVEALDLKVHRVVHAGEWAQKHAGPAIRVAWKRRENSNYELRYTIEAARLAAGVK